MNIDQVVTQLETKMSSDLSSFRTEFLGGGGELFSHRHAEELHVFGLKLEVDQPASDFRLLLLRVSIASIQSELITGEVMWFRSRNDFGTSDMGIIAEGFTTESIGRFTKDWSRLLESFEKAASRKAPLGSI